MNTEHKIFVNNSNNMSELKSNSVDLMVTSPPYPMIEMWDELFSSINEEISNRLEESKGKEAFNLMHDELNKVWEEVCRVIKPGGVACVNIGDATRKVNNSFQLYPNHVKVIDFFQDHGFISLPEILWRKPTNKAAKFMGSGMLPTNAYVTLEHEHILIFRKGKGTRKFKPKSKKRYNSCYFWEERNKWFSDVWVDIKGVLQEINHNELRERTAAFPLELPYRLINMYSIYGDTILDPFWGTGTTSLAAMISGRNSFGYELEKKFMDLFDSRLEHIEYITEKAIEKRIKNHLEFQKETEKKLNYNANHYDFRVTTKQEKNMLFYNIKEIKKIDDQYVIDYEKFNFSEENQRSIHTQSKLSTQI